MFYATCVLIFLVLLRVFVLLSLILSIYVAFLFIFRHKIENNQTSVYWHADELCLYCMFYERKRKKLSLYRT